MLSIRRVLCPIDWDEPSLIALSQAGELAARLEAELHVLHVVALAPPIASDIYISPGIAVSDRERLDEALAKVEDTIKTQVTSGIAAQAVVVMGYTANEIASVAYDRQIDLIVLATHGRTGLGHFLMGSVAEGVVQHSPCPVLALHPEAQAAQANWNMPQKILVCTDLSEASLSALDAGGDWAAYCGATLQVLHVGEEKSALAPAEIVGEDANSDISPLSTLIAERVPTTVATQPILKYGNATHEILQTVREEGTDLLVIGTHGTTGWRHLVFGSVTKHLVQSTPCPVLVVPTPQPVGAN